MYLKKNKQTKKVKLSSAEKLRLKILVSGAFFGFMSNKLIKSIH